MGAQQFFFNSVTGSGPAPGPVALLAEPFGQDGIDPSPSPNSIGFGGSTTLYYIPTGWSSNSTNDNMYVLNAADTGYSPCTVTGSSGNEVVYFALGFNYGARYLKTKSFSTVGKTNITMDFNLFDSYGTSATTFTYVNVEYSVDNVNWNSLTYTFADLSGSLGWQAITQVILPMLAENQANVWLKINFIDDGSFREVLIDDLTITGI